MQGRAVHGDRGLERDRAAGHIASWRQHPSEGLVHPLHDAVLRAEVACELQGLQANRSDTSFPGAQEETHLRLAESVDRLHRVTDDEERPPIPRRPVGNQALDQLELRDRRVLEFVDQQVPDPRVERHRDVAAALVTERGHGPARHFGEVHQSRFGKDDGQFGGGPPQHRCNRFDQAPLVFGVAGRRQRAQVVQRQAQFVIVPQGFEQARDPLLIRLEPPPFFSRDARRKSFGPGEPCPPMAVVRQQQAGEPTPGTEPFDGNFRERREICTRRQQPRRAPVGRRVAGKTDEFIDGAGRHRLAYPLHVSFAGAPQRCFEFARAQVHPDVAAIGRAAPAWPRAAQRHARHRCRDAQAGVRHDPLCRGPRARGCRARRASPGRRPHKVRPPVPSRSARRRDRASRATGAPAIARARRWSAPAVAPDCRQYSSSFGIPLANRTRQCVGANLMRLVGRDLCPRDGQRHQQSVLHLGGGLAGKGDRHHFFGRIDGREQREHALDQQFGLPGSGGRAHDE